MMTTAPIDDETIARWRLANQHLIGPPVDSVADVVDGLVCVQAENHAQASWAVATRSTNIAGADFATSFDRGDILRTHVLRPTWHFVTPADIGWLLDLTRPRIWPSRQRLAAQFGLDPSTLARAATTIVRHIDGDGPLTRDDLANRLSADALPSDGHGLGMSLEYAEVEGLICSGPVIDGQHTHELLERRAPHTRHLDRSDACAELARRYLTSHGPATVADLAYWASLTLTDARAAVASVADDLEHFDHDDKTYWHRTGQRAPEATAEPRAHILQILDESYRGYQDSRWVLDANGLAPRTREKATGMVLIDGQMAATMRRTIRTSHVRFDIGLLRELDGSERSAVESEAGIYGRFLDLVPEVAWSS